MYYFLFYFYGIIGGLKIELHLLSQRRNAALTSVYTFISNCIAMNLDVTSSGMPCLAHEWEDCHNQKCFRHKQIWNNLPTDWKKKGPVLRIIKGSIDVVSGHPFRFSNLFYIWNSFSAIKAQRLSLRTLSFLSSFAEAFTENSLFQLGRRWERQWRRKLIELALLTQRCQDHLLSNIPQSLKQGDERDYLQCPRKKKGKKLLCI